jgi:hypothetical protein
VPTLLCAGLGVVAEAQPAEDVAAIIRVFAAVVGAEPTFTAVCERLCTEVGAKLPPFVPPIDGTTLYNAADALDIAVLGALGAR